VPTPTLTKCRGPKIKGSEGVNSMPIFEFRCSCGATFEVIQREGGICICPTCSGVAEQVPAKSIFQLKGGGWAETGYMK
jgi:putative FmdB family regulatory protein